MPRIGRDCVEKLERHFVSQELYRRDDLAERQSRLARAVSETVIPQLLRLHAEIVPDAPAPDAVIEALAPNSTEVSALADIVLGSDLEAAVSYVVALRDTGLSMDTLFVELLEPTARRLGELWEGDECDFIDVTLGVSRLQKLLASFNNSHVQPELDLRRRIFMAVTPGDQHYFGATMVQRFLDAAGWSVQTQFDASLAQIGSAVRKDWFSVAGLTLGSGANAPNLKLSIDVIRKQSLNQDIRILVGGPAFGEDPGLADHVGADATARDAPTAVLVAQKLFDLATCATAGAS